MNLHLPAFSWGALQSRLKGMFNLNDPKWGRGEDKPDAGKPVEGGDTPPPPPPQKPRGPNQGPPDLEELWRDVSKKLGGLFGAPKGPRSAPPEGGGGSGFQPDMKNAGIGFGLHGGLFLALTAKNLDLHDHRAQLRLLVETVYQVIAASHGDLFAGIRHWSIGLLLNG